jgi:hypothetical protein
MSLPQVLQVLAFLPQVVLVFLLLAVPLAVPL